MSIFKKWLFIPPKKVTLQRNALIFIFKLHFFVTDFLKILIYKIFRSKICHYYMMTYFTKNMDYKFNCKSCDYYTNKKTDFKRHLETIKHKKARNSDNSDKKNENIGFKCNCGKVYKYRQGLSLHKNKCQNIQIFIKDKINNNIVDNIDNSIVNDTGNNPNSNQISNELVVQLISDNNEIKNKFLKEYEEIKNENKELRQQISELIPKVGNTNIVTNNNQKFNINVFLNEKCKDAISMNDFVHQIEVSIKNLLTTREKGLGIGLSNIIQENINKLSIYERPIHCTDKKRETLYIKNNKWEKDKDREKTKDMLKGLQSKQFKAMQKWIKEHPDYMEDDNLKHEYMILVNKCSSSIDDHEKKIMKKLCENTYLKDETIEE